MSNAASDAGPWAFCAVVLVCLLTGSTSPLLIDGSFMAGRRRRAARVVLAAVGVAAAVFLLAVDVPARFDAFKASPFRTQHVDDPRALPEQRQHGSLAALELRSGRVPGRAAPRRRRRIVQEWWTQHGSLPVFVRNAHSLYLETLGELGIVGLLLLSAFMIGSIGLGLSIVRRTEPGLRYQPAAPVAVIVAFMLAAALDWVWQLPVIGALAVACAALLAGAASGDPDPTLASGRWSPARIVAVASVVALVPLFVLGTIDATTQLRLGGSERAAHRGDGSGARADAQAARALEPWSAAPLLRLALVEERFGSLQVAHAAIEEAVRKDSGDWRLRLIAARLETKVGDVEAASQPFCGAQAEPEVAALRRLVLKLRGYVGRVRARILALLAAMAVAAAAATAANAGQPLATGILDPTSWGSALTPAELSVGYERARAAGATVVRIPVSWSSIAPATRPVGWHPADPDDPAYDWKATDDKIGAAVKGGLTPLVAINGAPTWARLVDSDASAPKADDYGDFARAIARRYSGHTAGLPHVKYWEAWVEPNLSPFFQPQFVDGKPVSATSIAGW